MRGWNSLGPARDLQYDFLKLQAMKGSLFGPLVATVSGAYFLGYCSSLGVCVDVLMVCLKITQSLLTASSRIMGTKIAAVSYP